MLQFDFNTVTPGFRCLRSRTWGILLVSFFLLNGCGTFHGQDDKISDKNEQIIAQVKLALVQESGLDAAPIDVKIRKGVVTLDGFVDGEFQRDQAVSAASRVHGVQSVINEIQVK